MPCERARMYAHVRARTTLLLLVRTCLCYRAMLCCAQTCVYTRVRASSCKQGARTNVSACGLCTYLLVRCDALVRESTLRAAVDVYACARAACMLHVCCVHACRAQVKNRCSIGPLCVRTGAFDTARKRLSPHVLTSEPTGAKAPHRAPGFCLTMEASA